METFNDAVVFNGPVTLNNTVGPAQPRTLLALEGQTKYPLALTRFRKYASVDVNIPGTPASNDLGISGGTYGTNVPKLTTGDVHSAGTTTRRARVLADLPPEYQAGLTVTVRVRAGMETTVADTSATVGVEVYQSNRDGTVAGANLVTTAAQSINSLSFADKDFQMTYTGLNPGDELDIRVTLTVVDAATGAAVQASIGQVALLLNIRG